MLRADKLRVCPQSISICIPMGRNFSFSIFSLGIVTSRSGKLFVSVVNHPRESQVKDVLGRFSMLSSCRSWMIGILEYSSLLLLKLKTCQFYSKISTSFSLKPVCFFSLSCGFQPFLDRGTCYERDTDVSPRCLVGVLGRDPVKVA